MSQMLTSPSLLALHTIFGYLNFHEGQQEAIESFVNNKDTLVLFPTGKGKSLCYSIGSLLINGITIVLSPLKALIEDQVMELIRSRIPFLQDYMQLQISHHHTKSKYL